MKTKFGFISIDNGDATWFFREDAGLPFPVSIARLDHSCILKTDNDGGVVYSEWPHVHSVPSLVTQLKRERVCEHKHIEVEKVEHHDLPAETPKENEGQ